MVTSLIYVELEGIEPSSKRGNHKLSTCLSLPNFSQVPTGTADFTIIVSAFTLFTIHSTSEMLAEPSSFISVGTHIKAKS